MEHEVYIVSIMWHQLDEIALGMCTETGSFRHVSALLIWKKRVVLKNSLQTSVANLLHFSFTMFILHFPSLPMFCIHLVKEGTTFLPLMSRNSLPSFAFELKEPNPDAKSQVNLLSAGPEAGFSPIQALK